MDSEKVISLFLKHSESSLRQIILNESQGPSSLRGYRSMWNKLQTTYDIAVPRDKVMTLLRELDPQASALRKDMCKAKKLKRRQYKSDGPNAVWHVDGYDKITPSERHTASQYTEVVGLGLGEMLLVLSLP